MAKDGKHVIHAGGIFANPQLHREGAAAAATQPGTVGFFDNTTKKFTASVDGNEDAILYVANYDYLRCKTVDDTIAAGDWVVAMHPTWRFLQRSGSTRHIHQRPASLYRQWTS